MAGKRKESPQVWVVGLDGRRSFTPPGAPGCRGRVRTAQLDNTAGHGPGLVVFYDRG